MSKIVAVCNQKGGVGKTTTVVNLSALLGQMGQRTLVVDIDPQGNATTGLGMHGRDLTVYHALRKLAPVADCIAHTKWENLDLLPSETDLAGLEAESRELQDAQQAKLLLDILTPLRDQYAFILIDCPPTLGLMTKIALTAADSVLVPIQAEVYAMDGLRGFNDFFQLARRRYNPRLSMEGYLLTMADGRSGLHAHVVSLVKGRYEGNVLNTVIPRNVRLAEAPMEGEPIHIYDSACRGAQAYRQLAEEFLARNGIEVPAAPKKGLFGRLKAGK